MGSRELKRGLGVLCAIGLCAGMVTDAKGGAGNTYNLGVFGGSTSSGGAVNNAGQVTGYSDTSNGPEHAFRYDGVPGNGGVMRDLGTTVTQESYGSAINDSGQVAGSSREAGRSRERAFRYDGTPGSGGTMRDLGVLPGGSESEALGINASGQVTGYAENSSFVTHAFRYDETPDGGGIMRDLGTLGGLLSLGTAINASGQVTGYSYIGTTGLYHAFRYDGTPGSDGIMHDLGTLGGYSEAASINDSGQIVGNSQLADGSAYHAFRYDGIPGNGGQMRDLGTINGWNSYADDINNAGYTVGYADPYPAGGNDTALLWRPDLSIVNLDAWLNSVNPTAGANWELYSASSISDTGWITGWGNYHEPGGQYFINYRAYLLDASALVPEPSGLQFLMIGAMALLKRRHPSLSVR